MAPGFETGSVRAGDDDKSLSMGIVRERAARPGCDGNLLLRSKIEDGVVGEGVIEWTGGVSVSSLLVETRGLRELEITAESSSEGDDWEAMYPTSGVPAREENATESSLSTLSTRIQMCRQIASEILGPCPSFSHS